MHFKFLLLFLFFFLTDEVFSEDFFFSYSFSKAEMDLEVEVNIVEPLRVELVRSLSFGIFLRRKSEAGSIKLSPDEVPVVTLNNMELIPGGETTSGLIKVRAPGGSFVLNVMEGQLKGSDGKSSLKIIPIINRLPENDATEEIDVFVGGSIIIPEGSANVKYSSDGGVAPKIECSYQ